MVDPPARASEVAPPPWQRTPQRATRRRRDPITREAIVDTALRVLDRDGLDGLSMRAIAEELHTGAASLYWHVGSKDGLLDLLFDRVIGEQPVPDPEPERWEEQLKEVGRVQRATILRHRDIVRISMGRIPMGPNALRYSERVLAIVRAGGVPDELAAVGQHLLRTAVNGFTLEEAAPVAAEDAETDEQAREETEDAAKMVSDYISSLPVDRFPNLVALADQFAVVDPNVRFELLLELFVGGLASRAEALKSQ